MKPVLSTFRSILCGQEGSDSTGTKDAPLISVILECLFVLSYDSAVRKICSEPYDANGETFGFGLLGVLKKYEGMEDIKDLVMYIRGLYDRAG